MKPPAFQFYAADFMMGTMAMSAEQVGGYIRLLCFQWDNGPIPDDQALLERISGCTSNAVASIRPKFQIVDSRLANPRLETERLKQAEYRAKQADKAHKRWDGNAKPHAAAIPSHMPQAMPNACPPSPSPSPSLIPLSTPSPDTEGRNAPPAAGPEVKARREIPTVDQWITAARESHPEWPETDARLAWEHYEKVGWKSGRNAIQKWRMCIGTCFRNWSEREARQNGSRMKPMTFAR